MPSPEPTTDARERLQQQEDLVACHAEDATWPSGLFSEALLPDGWMGLCTSADRRRRFVPAGDAPRLHRGDRLLLVRKRRISVPLAADALTTQDGFAFRASAELLVFWEAEEVGLAALDALLTARYPAGLTLAQLAAHLQHSGADALRAFVQTRSADPLARLPQRDELSAHLQEALGRAWFELGCRLDHVSQVHFESPMYDAALQRRLRQTEQLAGVQERSALEQARHAAALQRLNAAAGLLQRLRDAQQSDPAQPWTRLLGALAPGERGQLLESLWRVMPQTRVCSAVAAISGQECLWLDPAQPEAIARRCTLPDELGGLRSVTPWGARGTLLIGAASGVWMIDARDGRVLERFSTGAQTLPRTGFNSALVAHDMLYATHSQLGLWRWPLGKAQAGAQLLAPGGRAIRAAALLADGRVLLGHGADLIAVSDGAEAHTRVATMTGEIHAIVADPQRVAVSTADGKLLHAAAGHLEDWFVGYRQSGPIETLALRRWGDLAELVAPGGEAGVLGVYPEENVTLTLLRCGMPVRRVWAGDDLIVAMNDRRDRLALWRRDATAQPVEAPLARLTGNSIQDVCMITTAAVEPRAGAGADART